MSDLGRRLRDVPLPDEAAARERARRAVLATHVAPPPARRRLGPGAALLLAAAVIALGALTQPGQAVAQWLGFGVPARAVRDLVRDVVQPAPAPRPVPARTAPGALPVGGRLLVAGPDGAWALDRRGARRLGPWTAATWSPAGVYAAVAAGRRLAAVDPTGAVHWRLVAPAAVLDPRWAPDGTHVAYRAGRVLRVVYGNGTHDRPLASAVAAVAPAWRPHAPHALAWAGRDGDVHVTDADTGRALWRAHAGRVTTLAWSADGRRLLAAGARGGRIHDFARRRSSALALPRGRRLLAAAWSPRGDALALATVRRGTGQIALRGHRGALFSAPGRLTGLTWSPDGRWLAADWPTAGEWLLVRAGRRPRVEVVAGTARRYGAAARPQGWCCVG